jgi:hypothetical protein
MVKLSTIFVIMGHETLQQKQRVVVVLRRHVGCGRDPVFTSLVRRD